jgi:hypothetical protein
MWAFAFLWGDFHGKFARIVPRVLCFGWVALIFAALQ